MNPDQKGQLWTAFLSGELEPTDEPGLVRQLEADPAFLSDAVQDAELDGLLRELGRGRQDNEDRFVASVLGRLETSRLPLKSTRYPVVPPPRVLPLADNEPDNEPISQDSVSEESRVPIRLPISPQPSAAHRSDSTTRIWWTLVAPLAAVTLIAVTIAMIRETGRVAKKQQAPHSILPSMTASDEAEPGASETSTPESDLQPTILAENDDFLPAADTSSIEPSKDMAPRGIVAIGNSPAEETSDPVTADPDDSQAEPIIDGFAVLTDSPSDVLWYQRPRPGQQGRSLSLQRGTVEFQMASGATVTIEAPAEFAIDSPNSLLLARGRVSANVPKRAIGFTIDTPTVQIVDLGTRFETQVSSSAAVGLHVREGRVQVKSAGGAGESAESWIVEKDEQKFIESDGRVLDWKLEVTANVFGEITISVNGHPIPAESADDIEAVMESNLLDVIRDGGGAETLVGRYIFNDHERDDIGSGGNVAQVIADDFAALAVIARRVEDEDGVYRVKDKQYPYAGLREKLEARRKVARIYGPRALGGQFWPHEKFETVAADCDSLDALQRELMTRLDFVDLRSSSYKSLLNRGSTEFEVSVPAAVYQDATSTDSDNDEIGFERRGSDERNSLLRRLEQMRRGKESAAQVEDPAPSVELPVEENKTEVDSDQGRVDSDDAAAGQSIEAPDPLPEETSVVENRGRTLVRNLSEPDEMVAAALEAEMLGQQETRQELLGKVLRDHPTHPAANWQLGRMALGRDWLDATEVQERAKLSPVRAAYERKRADADDGSADGNLELARWCRARRPQASQMYYTRLLDDPQVTNPVIRNEAATNLELISYGGEYLSKSELARRQEFERRYTLASRRWNPPLQNWVNSLWPKSRDEHKQRAIDEMKEVDDPDMALIAKSYAGYGSELFDVNVVETLGRFPEPESTQCLARYGVLTMWPQARQASATALRDRKMHDYVPELLGSLIGMTKSEGRVERLIDGTIRFEHVFQQEGATENREQRTTRNAEPRINFAPVIEGGGNLAAGVRRLPDRDPRTGEDKRVERMFFTELARRNASAEVANSMAQMSNQRIYRLLADATGQQLPDETIAWWNWWQNYNGIEYEKSNQTYFDNDRFTYTALDFGPRYQRRHSCFAAGTLVATETGMRPIEEIVAGDRVFAKHPETGELKLQTVLLTTIRPPSPVIELRIDDEKIRTTPGHPFWVTGKGWRMTKLLQEGDQLHGMRGILNLEQVRPLVNPESVYNLVVAEFSNYFVGSSMALVHDNTFRRPTPALIPGL